MRVQTRRTISLKLPLSSPAHPRHSSESRYSRTSKLGSLALLAMLFFLHPAVALLARYVDLHQFRVQVFFQNSRSQQCMGRWAVVFGTSHLPIACFSVLPIAIFQPLFSSGGVHGRRLFVSAVSSSLLCLPPARGGRTFLSLEGEVR